MPGEIVVGFDGAPGARAALAEGVRLAADLGAPLVIAFCYGQSPLGGEVKDLAQAVREEGERHREEALGVARAAGVTAEFELVADRPAAGLVRIAAALEAQMIVAGSNGEAPFTGAFLGSTAHKLVHLSEIPVLVVRAQR